MAAYEEKLPARCKSILFIIFAFLTIYFPLQLGDWELRWDEDQYAVIAAEMDIYHPNTIAHGEQIAFTGPMFPWLAAVLHKTGLSLEFCIRFISVISLGGLVILAWEAGRRANDLQTAIVSAAMMCSSVIVIEKATDGFPDFTGLLFLFSAWLAWFTFGVARGKWNLAWIISFFFASMAFYTIGWHAVLIFIFPLIFMRRPMTVWSKLNKPGFFIGVAILIFFMLIWILPRWIGEANHPFKAISIDMEISGDYIQQLLTFPFALFFRFLPWSLLAWPAFCVAYFPLDKNPIFSRFLRTIVISLFFFLWFSPFTESRDMIVLAPPLAILCGINYWLLVRRHGLQLHAMLRYFLYAAVALSSGIIIFYIMPASILEKIPFLEGKIAFRKNNEFMGLIQAAFALIIALIAIQYPKNKLRVYATILMICISGALCFWALHIPYRKRHTAKRDIGAAFASALKKDLNLTDKQPLPDGLVIFKEPPGFYAPSIYMGVRVQKIYNLTELPDDIDPLYMIFTKFPVSTKRSWEYIDPEKTHIWRREKIFILKGTRIKKEKENPSNP